MDYPSTIDAQQIDKDNNTKRLKPENIVGKIEFKNVWFRYPTRRHEWVLRGLNLTINP